MISCGRRNLDVQVCCWDGVGWPRCSSRCPALRWHRATPTRATARTVWRRSSCSETEVTCQSSRVRGGEPCGFIAATTGPKCVCAQRVIELPFKIHYLKLFAWYAWGMTQPAVWTTARQRKWCSVGFLPVVEPRVNESLVSSLRPTQHDVSLEFSWRCRGHAQEKEHCGSESRRTKCSPAHTADTINMMIRDFRDKALKKGSFQWRNEDQTSPGNSSFCSSSRVSRSGFLEILLSEFSCVCSVPGTQRATITSCWFWSELHNSEPRNFWVNLTCSK